MHLIEWEVAEDGYEEQIIIPKEKRELAAKEGINTENKEKVTVRIMNLKTGESYLGRLAITGTYQIYIPTEIQQMLEESGEIRIQILGGWKKQVNDPGIADTGSGFKVGLRGHILISDYSFYDILFQGVILIGQMV